jgi:hypothetical protein
MDAKQNLDYNCQNRLLVEPPHHPIILVGKIGGFLETERFHLHHRSDGWLSDPRAQQPFASGRATCFAIADIIP